MSAADSAFRLPSAPALSSRSLASRCSRASLVGHLALGVANAETIRLRRGSE